MTVSSIFSGRSATTSSLTRRSTNGDTSACRRAALSPSACSTGLSKRLANDSRVPKRPGIKKSKMLQSSDRRFSMGVPVRAKRTPAGRRLAARATCVSGFLMYWASSSTTRAKSCSAYSSISRRMRSYEVTTTLCSATPAICTRRCALTPTTAHTSSEGAKRSSSAVQLYTSDAGHTTSVGLVSPASTRARICAIICSVLPRPMSSAKIPPRPRCSSEPSHW